MRFPRLLTSAAILALAVVVAVPVQADGAWGAYLAARLASRDNDFAKAAEYYSRALQRDTGNPTLMGEAVAAYVGLGRFDRALPFARRLASAEVKHQVANIVMVSNSVRAGEYEPLLDQMGKSRLQIAPLVDGLVKAWAEVGAGRMSDALVSFDALSAQPSSKPFGFYHKALALAVAGDLEAADAILSADGENKLNLTRRGVVVHAEILSQLERNPEAIAALERAFGTDLDPALRAMRARLQAGETLPLSVVRSASDGVAEVFFTVATALNGDAPDPFTLAFARATEYLRPDHADAILTSASLLDRMKRYDLAIEAYSRIGTDNLYYHVAAVGRAGSLERQGKPDDAIGVLLGVTEVYADLPAVFVTLGDALRRQDRYGEAKDAYDRAIELYGEPKEAQWGVYFARGIAHERTKQWDKAEADFRASLRLRPNQPQVLNYLGYSYVEMKLNLDEALDLIERAAAARPDDGYITDSLGWVYYRLGRYDEAVVQMERAVKLRPVDPVLNDHLGDVYWAVGRKREAEFQWRRALSFDPDDADETRIRRKLEVGLDAVLREEGSEPLAVAKDG